ncbi:diguanylate cyclase [Ideonella azotifigens]|uniref:Diguanylate cyclase n=1 Tax=Ideonella azotifigens TaxID=513160 RepID=A0ABN1JSR7_9BURK|nr:diguanylate cyclase [Ideonella azotifigens]MCD2340953.1 diguanylate cyclase [Ideonella azotifigens]
MPVFRWLSLRQLLTLPYVVLVLLLTLVLGTLSYRAGRIAVDSLSDQLLTETVGRISQAVELHVLGSGAVLETAFPRGMSAPPRVADGLDALRTRFWLATSVHPELNNYVYYGDEQGHFFGLLREGGEQAQLRLRLKGEGPRSLYEFKGIHGALGPAKPEERIFEPRQRPWYQAGHDAPTETWTSIYIDFRTRELISTRARRVLAEDGHAQGVVATDVTLRHLSAFVHSLPLSPHGIAFVTEPNGNLIATSRGDYLRNGADGQPVRLNAADSSDGLLKASHAAVQALLQSPEDAGATRAMRIDGPDGDSVQLAHARIRDAAGLDWLIVVAVPRSDFLQRVSDNAMQSLLLGLLAAVAVVAIGLLSLEVLSRDLKQIATAARQVGEGRFDPTLDVQRQDEIGDLARSFSAMTQRLATDRLTGLASREAMLRRIEDRLAHHRRSGDHQPFALLFLDVNGFKAINDNHGHAVGDKVLVELGERMRGALREEDSVARLAGDEFLVLLELNEPGEGTDPEAALAPVLAKLKAAFAKPLDSLAGLPATEDEGLEVAIGVALYPEHGDDVTTLLAQADADMYRRKPRRR